VNFDEEAQWQQGRFLGRIIFPEEVVVIEKLERSLAQLGENISGVRGFL
jgi:hypothetical protein